MEKESGLLVLNYIETILGFIALIVFGFGIILVFNKDVKMLLVFCNIIGFIFFMDGLDDIILSRKCNDE